MSVTRSCMAASPPCLPCIPRLTSQQETAIRGKSESGVMWCGLQASMRCTSPERSSRLSMDATLAYALEIAVHTPRAQMLCVADEMRLVARSEGLTLRQKTVAFPSRQISALHLYADHLVPGAKARLLQMSLYSSARGFGGIPKHSVGVTCLSAANISSLNMPACPRIVRRGIEYAEVCLSGRIPQSRRERNRISVTRRQSAFQKHSQLHTCLFRPRTCCANTTKPLVEGMCLGDTIFFSPPYSRASSRACLSVSRPTVVGERRLCNQRTLLTLSSPEAEGREEGRL